MPSKGVAISITDTGTGIRREDAGKLFQPFFTTKAAKGTGLGLWISKGIIQKYEGRITFRSLGQRKGSVTSFRIFLPADAMSGAGKPGRSDIDQPASIATM